MRAWTFALSLAVVITLTSQPAFAFSKHDFLPAARAQAAAHVDPCASSMSPHTWFGRRADASACHRLLVALEERSDEGMLAECDRLAFALNGRRCESKT